MIRPVSFVLFAWLALLFVVGQGAHVPQWIVWLDGLAAGGAAFIGAVSPMLPERAQQLFPVALSLGLLALWILGMAVHSPPWLPWCNFMGAISYGGIAVSLALWSPRGMVGHV